MTSKLYQFIKKRKVFVWYVHNLSSLSENAIVEAVLNQGDWRDVQELIGILGIKKTAKIFFLQSHKPRNNYHPKIANYFNLYFKKYAR